MELVPGNPKQIYFYYRYCETTKMETFIVRETPITDNLNEMYESYPSDIEFPLGTIFSIISRLMEDIVGSVSIEDTLNRITECLDELSNDVEDVKAALKLFVLVAQVNNDYCNINGNENIAIYNLNMFLTECWQNTTYATNDYLEKLILTHNIPFPKSDKIVVDYSYSKAQREYMGDDMKKFLDNTLPDKNMWNKIFDGLPIYKYHYYTVSTISGLISTLLKVIFDNRKVIGFCEHCHKYFVPLKRSDEKYCITNKYFGNQDCKMAVRMEQQRNRLSMKQNDVDKMERSVRTMIYYRARQGLPKNQISEEEFKGYKRQINEFKTGVLNGKYTIEEYKTFLKTFYRKSKE